ncbi:HlyD family secretion protein [Neobacillus ginsengisoli]|uniref:Multidrug resistance efflux pump n=1 Tax=Neobacillus ginsengisoli TaxID=904295 RepID=A0ABT9XXV1_9BACI|nr:efflux RND transporter periplasmic adaptor subunit [Neobacillus ginsengisoli]MDQ0200085.1 multidrug resistance efflux pump [Neobacillus ginsengisoli]
MKETKRLILFNVVIILIVVIAGFAGYYFYNQSSLYLKTDNAQVTGQQLVIAAPEAGKLVSWNGSAGTKFNSGDTVGQVQLSNGNTSKNINIPIPQDGTIVQNNATTNEYVAPGTPLAYAYDMNKLYVTANIDETKIQDVKVGNTVDVYVDAFPDTTVTGTVNFIGQATASTFSLIPSSSTNANFTKVTQVIPVTIELKGIPAGLEPGMNVSVRIHK